MVGIVDCHRVQYKGGVAGIVDFHRVQCTVDVVGIVDFYKVQYKGLVGIAN